VFLTLRLAMDLTRIEKAWSVFRQRSFLLGFDSLGWVDPVNTFACPISLIQIQYSSATVVCSSSLLRYGLVAQHRAGGYHFTIDRAGGSLLCLLYILHFPIGQSTLSI